MDNTLNLKLAIIPIILFMLILLPKIVLGKDTTPKMGGCCPEPQKPVDITIPVKDFNLAKKGFLSLKQKLQRKPVLGIYTHFNVRIVGLPAATVRKPTVS